MPSSLSPVGRELGVIFTTVLLTLCGEIAKQGNDSSGELPFFKWGTMIPEQSAKENPIFAVFSLSRLTDGAKWFIIRTC